jgi:hypothetical protein
MRFVLATSYRVLYALAGLALVIVNALIDRQIVHWDQRVAAVGAIGVGLVACFDNIRLIRYKLQAHERNAARARMYRPMFIALVSVAEARSMQTFKFGVSVFRIKPCWYLHWHVIPWRQERLVRLVRLRLSDNPNESEVVWTKGKGAIGECWANKVPVLHDRRRAAATFGRDHYPSEAEFAQLSSEERRGMTRSEFVETIDKYGEILAVPIVEQHSGKILGVLSIDCLAEAYANPQTPSVLEGQDIETFAVRAARLTREDVAKF